MFDLATQRKAAEVLVWFLTERPSASEIEWKLQSERTLPPARYEWWRDQISALVERKLKGKSIAAKVDDLLHHPELWSEGKYKLTAIKSLLTLDERGRLTTGAVHFSTAPTWFVVALAEWMQDDRHFDIRRCARNTCGRLFPVARPKGKGPPPRYCTPEHRLTPTERTHRFRGGE